MRILVKRISRLKILAPIKLILLRKLWRKKNKHNYTEIAKAVSLKKLTVGKETYGILIPLSYGDETEKLTIGSYCSIGPDVKFILGQGHNYNSVTSYPLRKKYLGCEKEIEGKGEIIVKDDVWIGHSAIILPGVTIGQGAIIGAGSIVSKDIPPYAIFAGGEIKKYRFKEEIIKELLKINFSKISPEDIKELSKEFTEELTEQNYKRIIEKILKKGNKKNAN